MITIREATVNDAQAITEVHKSDVKKWRKIEDNGFREANYEELSIDERWLHGGQWMSYETCVIHIQNFIKWGGKIFVATLNNNIVGEIELIADEEPEPYGEHLFVYVLMIHKSYRGRGIGSKLIRAAEEYARERGINRILVSSEERSIGFYRKMGYQLFEEYLTIRVNLSNKINLNEPVRYEVLDKITKKDVYDYQLLIGRFLNSISLLYNASVSYPSLQKVYQRYFFFKIYDEELDSIIVIRKSNLISNAMYIWVSKLDDIEFIINTFIKGLYLANKLDINELVTCIPAEYLSVLRKTNLKLEILEKAPWFIRKLNRV